VLGHSAAQERGDVVHDDDHDEHDQDLGSESARECPFRSAMLLIVESAGTQIMRTLVPITFASSNTVTRAASAFDATCRACRKASPGFARHGLDGGRPDALAEVVQVERPALGRREEQRRVPAGVMPDSHAKRDSEQFRPTAVQGS
jgi:hypothetical protein